MEELLQPEDLQPSVELCQRVLAELDAILLGRPELHRMVLIGILSHGHILLEGVPGVGKTALIQALGQLLDLQFNRVQFTPDLMPTDILGMHILQDGEHGREMVFRPGPVFSNLLLADEINRASPKTQSALLEAMQERSVTLLGKTHRLPSPFFVLASQNPIEMEGTYPLPEAQLDRFLFRLKVERASVTVLDEILRTRRRGKPPVPEFRVSPEELQRTFECLDKIFLPRPVSRYIARIVDATHPQSAEAPELVRQSVGHGASPRAAIGIAEAARACALLQGRPTVGFQDVRDVAPHALNHRLVLHYQAQLEGIDGFVIAEAILGSLKETGLDLPAGMTLETQGASR